MSVRGEWPEGVDVSALADAVSICASRSKFRHSKVASLEEEDIQQELWLWAWRKRAKVADYLGREEKKDRKRGWSALLTALGRAAERYAQKVKAKDSGYEVQDVAWYNEDSLRDWIGVLVNGVGVLTNQGDELSRRAAAPLHERFNTEATLADVQAALQVLDQSDQAMLVRHYGHGVSSPQLAEMLDMSESTVERRMKSALKSMVDYLGGPRPW